MASDGIGYGPAAALISVAQRNGIAHVHADVLADNYAMLTLARKRGCETRIKMTGRETLTASCQSLLFTARPRRPRSRPHHRPG